MSVPESIDMEGVAIVSFFHFLQQQANRRAVGALRYEKDGIPDRRKRYLDRLKKEVAAYERTGNHEQLINVAVYAFLESYAPQNSKYHFNPNSDSVTRKEFGA